MNWKAALVIALLSVLVANQTQAQPNQEPPGYLVSVYQEWGSDKNMSNGGAITIRGATYVTGSVVLIQGQRFVLTSSAIAKPPTDPDVRFSSTTTCRFANGAPQTLITLHGWSDEMGCALFKLGEDHPFNGPYAEFGDSDKLKKGARVTAWGTPQPLKLGVTFTWALGGINDPDFHWQVYEHYKPIRAIRHDATLTGGYGGGPLITKDEKVVGINCGALTRGPNLLMSFAIPINDIQRILPKLALGGKVKCGAISPSDTVLLHGKLHAAQAETGEAFISLNNKRIRDLEELRDEARFIDPGQTAEVTIGNGHTRSTMIVTIVEAKDN